MKILIRNADDVVIYAGDDLALTAEAVAGNGWLSPIFNAANSRLEDADLPAGYVGAAWHYAGGEWSIVDPARVNETLSLAVPESVTNVQARLAMLNAGLLDDATSAVTALGEAALIEWEHSAVIHRDSPLVAEAAAALGLTDEQVDALFVSAAAL